MMTKDYQRCTQGQVSRDSPSTNDINSERHLSGPSDGAQICKTLRQEGSGRIFVLTGTRNHPQTGQCGGYHVLKAPFQKLTDIAITPQKATPGSVGYNVFTPIDFTL